MLLWMPYHRLPYVHCDPESPFFRYEARWLDDRPLADDLHRQTRIYFRNRAIILGVVCLGLVGAVATIPGLLYLLVVVGGACLNILFYQQMLFRVTFVIGVLNMTRRDLDSQRFEAVQLTGVDMTHIVRAKMAMNQMVQWDTWRSGYVLVMMMAFSFLLYVSASLILAPENLDIPYTPSDTFTILVNGIAYLLLITLLAGLLALEMRWSYDLLAALGIYLASTRLYAPIGGLLGGLVALAMWISFCVGSLGLLIGLGNVFGASGAASGGGRLLAGGVYALLVWLVYRGGVRFLLFRARQNLERH